MKLYNLCCNSLLTDLSALVLIHPPLYGQKKKKIPVVITHNESLWMTLTFLMAKSKILWVYCALGFYLSVTLASFHVLFPPCFSALICLDSLYQSFLNTWLWTFGHEIPYTFNSGILPLSPLLSLFFWNIFDQTKLGKPSLLSIEQCFNLHSSFIEVPQPRVPAC